MSYTVQGGDTEYELSENQEQFVMDAEDQGLEVDYDYSGRHMYGRECQCVRVDNEWSFKTAASATSDSMGKGIVIYAPN